VKKLKFRRGNEVWFENMLTTMWQSRGITQKPDGRRGSSSDNVTSTGANTSWEHTPTAFLSIPLHSCCSQWTQSWSVLGKKMNMQYRSMYLLACYKNVILGILTSCWELKEQRVTECKGFQKPNIKKNRTWSIKLSLMWIPFASPAFCSSFITSRIYAPKSDFPCPITKLRFCNQVQKFQSRKRRKILHISK